MARTAASFVGTAALVSGLLSVPLAAAADPRDGISIPGPEKVRKDAQKYAAGTYIVSLKDAPAATYTGGVNGYAATKAAKGKQLDASKSTVTEYADYLSSKQKTVAATVGAKIIHSYTLAGNGFAAKLTGSQAARLAKASGVRSVVKNEILHTTAERSIDYLGITGDGGTWEQLGGDGNLGAGVVIGDIDTGIAPENPSFAGDPLGATPGEDPYLATHRGVRSVVFEKSDGTTFSSPVLENAEQWDPDEDLSTKIIGAQYFVEGFGEDYIGTPEADAEYLSPRDGAGHGSHTAGTAAGVQDVPASVEGVDFGAVSGVAPDAKLAVYKACWTGNVPGTTADDGCATADLIAAIDAATSDGVDVINFSIGGGSATTTDDIIDEYFLGAAAAGIFVSASAGNSGPGPSTADHGSPWYTTVAASTIPDYEGTVVLGNGDAFLGLGVSVQETVGAAPFVEAAAVALDEADPDEARLCFENSLDPAQVAGTIVLCDRGSNDRVAKSAEVARAGGAGMVLVNVPGEADDVDNDFHSVPSVHLHSKDYDAVHAYAETADAEATLEPGDDVEGEDTPVPQLAAFSSRGPILAAGSDILKPDVAAPGVSILAAVANAEGAAPQYAFYSGTSMAAPHVTGLAALYLSRDPGASPMEIKSALMTTASDLLDAQGDPYTDPFGQGAGQVEPVDYLDPALVYLSDLEDWYAYLVGAGYYTEDELGVAGVDPSDVNQPSIAIGDLLGHQAVTRSVTARTAGTYTASISVPGVSASVEPSTLTLDAGESATFTVRFDTGGAALDAYTTGFLTWASSGGNPVRSPIAIHPTSALVPASIEGTGTTGSTRVHLTGGFDGSLPVTVEGFTAVDQSPNAEDPTSPYSGHGDQGDQFQFEHEVEAGTTSAEFNVYPRETAGLVDLDLYVYYSPDGSEYTVVASSATAAAAESVTIDDPEPGSYVSLIDVYSAPSDGVDFVDEAWVYNPAEFVGDPKADPTPLPVQAGEETSLDILWTGLPANSRFRGHVRFGDAIDTPIEVTTGATIVPTVVTPPTVSGSVQVGATVTASPGTWNALPSQLSFAYRWTASGSPIPGATGRSFTIPAHLLGASLGVTVTATNVGDKTTGTATVTAGTVVAAGSSTLVNTARPTISGSAKPGRTLTAGTGSWNVATSELAFTYQWLANGKPITGATSKTYKVPASRAGDRIAVVVTAHLDELATAATSRTVIPKWNSRTTIFIKDATITTKQKAKITVKVNAAGSGKETGIIVLHYDAKKKRDLMHLPDKGKVTFTLPKLKKGSYKVWAEYKGTSTVEPDDSITKKLRVLKA